MLKAVSVVTFSAGNTWFRFGAQCQLVVMTASLDKKPETVNCSAKNVKTQIDNLSLCGTTTDQFRMFGWTCILGLIRCVLNL